MFGLSASIGPGNANETAANRIVNILPILMTVGVIAFLFVAFGDRATGNLSFVASQIGPAFVLLSIVCAMLFVSHVLIPHGGESQMSRRYQVVLGVVGLLPPASLVIATVIYRFQGPYAIASVAIAMIAAASGLAFGLFYRGMFAHEEFLEREIDRLETAVVSIRLMPGVTSILPPARDSDEVGGSGLREPAAGLGRVARYLRVFWLRSVSPAASTESHVEDPDGFEAAIRDARFRKENLAVLTGLRERRAKLAFVVGRLKEIETKKGDLQRLRTEIEDERRRRDLSLTIEEERALIEFENAYSLAQSMRRNAENEGPRFGVVGAGGR